MFTNAKRTISTAVVALLLSTAWAAAPAVAQEFPKKQPIKIVVGFSPGGGTDLIARVTAEFLQRRLGQTVVVENRPGAASTIANNAVARAPADGYTLLLVSPDFAIVPAVRKNLPYDFRDFTYLIRPFSVASVLLGSPKYAPSSLPELLADMRARPGQVRYGSAGIGSTMHMGMALLEAAAAVQGLHVPYQGMAPALNGMFAGTIDISAMGSPVPEEGLKVLASSGTRRNPQFPEVPTLEEYGIQGASWDVWWGFFAPPNLPKPIADRLITELTAVIQDPQAIARYTAAMKFAPETQPLAGEDFKRFVLQEHGKWQTVVAREKIEIE